ncbi:MAG: PilZ domain-containing protein [Phycisphaerae bacterium]|nr:PilZ domain-containing protein [Phycisphaerae bacterium]
MRKRKFATGTECDSLLGSALEKKMPLTITKKCIDNNWQVYKSHVLLVQERRLVISMPNPHDGVCPMEPAPNQEIAVTFKKGYNKCLFVSRIISQSQLEVEGENGERELVPVLIIYKPEQIEKIQRRAYDRTNVPSGEDVTVSFWSVSRPQERFQGFMLNLSAGGLAVSMPIGQATPAWESDQQCELQFVALPGQEPIIAHARYRHTTHTEQDAQPFLGFQFIGLELSEQGRNTLRRIGRVTTVYDRRNYSSQHSRR